MQYPLAELSNIYYKLNPIAAKVYIDIHTCE